MTLSLLSVHGLLEYCSLLFLLDLFILFYVYGCPVQMWVCAPCSVPGVQRPNEGVRSVMDGCESSCECWEWNPGLLQEQPVLVPTEQPLKSQQCLFHEVPWKTTISSCCKQVKFKTCWWHSMLASVYCIWVIVLHVPEGGNCTWFS